MNTDYNLDTAAGAPSAATTKSINKRAGLAVTLLLSSGLALVGLGLGSGTAQATPAPAPESTFFCHYHWNEWKHYGYYDCHGGGHWDNHDNHDKH